MGNQVGIINLLPDGNVNFPGEQQVVNTCIQFSKIFQAQGIPIKTQVYVGTITRIPFGARAVQGNLLHFPITR